jgi:hypothetical protein
MEQTIYHGAAWYAGDSPHFISSLDDLMTESAHYLFWGIPQDGLRPLVPEDYALLRVDSESSIAGAESAFQ